MAPVHRVGPHTLTGAAHATLVIWIDSVTSVSITVREAVLVFAPDEPPTPIAIAAKMTELLQDKLDSRIPISDLPDGVNTGDVPDNIDPDRTIDPARHDLFWQTIDGVVNLVSRSIVVVVDWTGTQYLISVSGA